MEASYALKLDDARTALDFAAAVAECTDAAALDTQIESLSGLIGAEGVVVLSSRDWMAETATEAGDRSIYLPGLLEAAERAWRDHPLIGPDLVTAARGARRLSDFVRTHEWRRRAMFNDFYRPLGMANELAVQLAWSPGSSCCLALHRGGRDFDQRELALLGLVAPHLRAARGRIAAGPRADAVLLDHDAAVAMLARRLPITAREAEVLARLTAGRTNAGIALDLGISPHTVRRHVEKLYAKLDVHTRAGATRMALAAFGD